jgi:hypothetical protein
MNRASSRRLEKTTVLVLHCYIKLLLSFMHTKLPAKKSTILPKKFNFIKISFYCQVQFAVFRARPHAK